MKNAIKCSECGRWIDGVRVYGKADRFCPKHSWEHFAEVVYDSRKRLLKRNLCQKTEILRLKIASGETAGTIGDAGNS